MKKILVAASVVTFAMSAQSALAAPFSGPYVGAEISHDSYEVKADNVAIGGYTVSADGLSGDGVAGGVYAGYDLRVSSFFVGLEGNLDYSGASITASGTDGVTTLAASVKARESYGVSGRLGAVIGNSTGIYAKLGWRATRFKTEATSNGTSLFTESRTKSAFVYGAGLETALTSNATVRVEYTMANYGSAGLDADLGVSGIKVTDSKVAAGVSWRF